MSYPNSRTSLRAWATENPVGNLEFTDAKRARIMHDPVTLVMGAATVAGGLASASASKSAANKQAQAAENASDLQYKAAQEANALQREVYQQNRSDQAPWRGSGVAAANKLGQLLGLGGNIATAAPTVESRADIYNRLKDSFAIKQAPQQQPGPQNNGAGFYSGYYDGKSGMGENNTWFNEDWVPYGLTPQSQQQQPPQSLGAQFDFDALNRAVDDEYGKQQAAYNQWQQGQQAGANDPSYGSLLKNFSLEDFQADPSYQFRKAEGEKGINRSLLSRGQYDSGAALKELNRYNSDLASQEYGNAYNRDNQNKSRVFNFLQSVSGLGQNAASQTGNNASAMAANIGNTTTQSAALQGNYLTSGANALAAGQVGSANALSGGLSSAYNNYQMNSILGNLGKSQYNALDPSAASKWGDSYSGFNNPSNYG